MSNDLNSCSFIGRLGKDPDVKEVGSNNDMCASFSIAVGKTWKDKNTGEKTERTEWVRCVAWRGLADIVDKYCTKGKQVFVSGELQTRKWADKEGVDRYTIEIVLDKLILLGSKTNPDPGPSEAPPAKKGKGKATTQTPAQKSFDDDIPF